MIYGQFYALFTPMPYMPQGRINSPVDLTANGRFMLSAMKWLLFTVLSFQLMVAPPCVAATDCEQPSEPMAHSGHGEAPGANHAVAASADTSHQNPCDDCADPGNEPFAMADNPAAVNCCPDVSGLAIIAAEPTREPVAILSAGFDFTHAPPVASAVFPSPRMAILQRQNIFLRTSRLRL